MINHDRLFKELLSTFFVEFLELFFPQVLDYLEQDSITFLDKEIFTDVTEGEEYEADLVVKARFRNQESYFLIHLEHQAQTQANFGRRMFRYFALLFDKEGLPVYPIAIFSFNSPKRPEPDIYRVEFPDKVVLEFNYAVIQLNNLNWRDFLQRENPVSTALMAKMNIAPQDRPKVKSECLRLLATLRLDPARTKMISGFVDTYLRLNAQEEEIFQTEIAKFTPNQQEVVMEIVTSWMEEGIRRGRVEGRQEGEIAIIIRQLNRRIGTITPELEARIKDLCVNQLEDLAEALLDFTNVVDLVNWLERL
ncbi:MAG TPA: DUF4351 domain-containing protein [Nostocaceae cyanobacterium]|nr:DUF4351 domain-containing protein [Nostocaceae cyanobacterium]